MPNTWSAIPTVHSTVQRAAKSMANFRPVLADLSADLAGSTYLSKLNRLRDRYLGWFGFSTVQSLNERVSESNGIESNSIE